MHYLSFPFHRLILLLPSHFFFPSYVLCYPSCSPSLRIRYILFSSSLFFSLLFSFFPPALNLSAHIHIVAASNISLSTSFTTPHLTSPNHIIPCLIAPNHTTPHYITPRHTISHHISPYHTTLHHISPHHTYMTTPHTHLHLHYTRPSPWCVLRSSL